MKDPVLSLCVCTLDGASRIADTLWSLVCQSADPDRYEILVIENDVQAQAATKRVVDDICGTGREIRLVIEPKLGLSNARNRAVLESRGDFVFFIDDDATASPRLVESYIRAIEEQSPDVIGGNIQPLFEQPPPPELEYSWWPHWSLKHFGAQDRWLATDEYFLGTNVGASRTLLMEHAFDARLGRTGEDLTGGEEWYLGDQRFRRRFVAAATVFHQVPVERMQPRYFVKRMYFGTISRARITDPNASLPTLPRVERLRRHLRRPAGQAALLFRKLVWAARIAFERRRFIREKIREKNASEERGNGGVK
ncbi:MAG: glycosyltransferase [Myxococcales bacterium]|nr:glycosyltransferase [Myxococcales bacterium]